MTQVRFHYRCPFPLKRPGLVGSWDDRGRYDRDWSAHPIALTRSHDGDWTAEVTLSGRGQEFHWGVRDGGDWLIFDDAPPSFILQRYRQDEEYCVSALRHMGARRRGQDLEVRVWSPHARAAWLVVGESQRFAMTREQENFFVRVPAGWARYRGQPYSFEFVTSEGERVRRCDPYARIRQGPQAGIQECYLDEQGGEVHRYMPARSTRFLRFEAVSRAAAVQLYFTREGKPLKRSQLRKLLGNAGRAVAGRAGRAFWSDRVETSGRIFLESDGPFWSVLVNRPQRLHGLRYHLVDKDGKTFHCRHNNLLTGHHEWPRFGIIEELAERTSTAPSRRQEELVIYQLHVGSFKGSQGNGVTSNFSDLTAELDYLEKLGPNTLELLPTNAFEGPRDWGYAGTSSLAMAESYGYHEEGRWVNGSAALRRFLAAAQKRGLSVVTDVVYNHLGGEHCDLWHWDGRKNPWFEWSADPVVQVKNPLPYLPGQTADAPPETLNTSVRNTPWGPIPAYNKAPVAQFFVDHAISQFLEYGFDGIRFDFTHYIHGADGGGHYGWQMLRKLHRIIDYFFPDKHTFAEEFPQHSVITTPPGPGDSGGAGFSAMWNTEFQHRLVFHHHSQALLQALAADAHTDLDRLVNHMIQPDGFSHARHSVTVISNHDEVGNAERMANLLSGQSDRDWAEGILRCIFAIGLYAPGMPIFFQGTENLASNRFLWGRPTTWDLDWSWRDDPQGARHRHFDFCCQALKLRRHPDFNADSPFGVVLIHNDHSLLGYLRGGHLVLANLGRQTRELKPAVTGKWRLRLHSRGGRKASFTLAGATVAVFEKR